MITHSGIENMLREEKLRAMEVSWQEIETKYRMSLDETLAWLEVKHGEFDRKQLYAHRRFVEPMLEYILGDDSIGAMVICDSGSKGERKDWVADYKGGKLDILFVYNILLIGSLGQRECTLPLLPPRSAVPGAADYPATLLKTAPAVFAPARLHYRIKPHSGEGNGKIR